MHIQEIQYKKIAFKALDWGLGHVTRSLSVLKQLLDQKNELIIFGTKKQIEIYLSYKIEARFIKIQEIDWKFSGSGNKLTEGFQVAKAVLKKKKQSNGELEDFLVTNEIDFVISDHDYGFYSLGIPSIFMTHQLNLPESTPWIAQRVHKSWLKSFAFFWIVDEEKERLAGKLSELNHDLRKNLNYQYIGLRSRYSIVEMPNESEIPILIIISGPKPYSTQFLETLLTEIKKTDEIVHVVCPKEIQIEDNQLKYASSNSEADKWFLSAKLIVSRSGYSTLMDCKLKNKKGLFLATKGQLEQVYLASKINVSNWNLFCESEVFIQKFNEHLSEI
jgi:hypothetical protein